MNGRKRTHLGLVAIALAAVTPATMVVLGSEGGVLTAHRWLAS